MFQLPFRFSRAAAYMHSALHAIARASVHPPHLRLSVTRVDQS